MPHADHREPKGLRAEVRDQTVGYISTALGLVAGLAWNDAIRSFIDAVIPAGANTLFARLLYAIAVTIVVVLLTRFLLRRR